MAALRLDCRTVRNAVERKNLRAGLKAIERLRELRINRRNLPVPESFAAFETALRERILELHTSMRANDQAGSEAALAGMLSQCTSCHSSYRALGAEEGLLR